MCSSSTIRVSKSTSAHYYAATHVKLRPLLELRPAAGAVKREPVVSKEDRLKAVTIASGVLWLWDRSERSLP
jgi:hypothetical protein